MCKLHKDEWKKIFNLKNKLQTEADEINQKFNGYFLACPGFDEITVIADTKPDITEYQISYPNGTASVDCSYEHDPDITEYHISYPNGTANVGCCYEQKDGKLITKVRVTRNLASGDDEKFEKLIAIAKKYEG